MNKRLMMMAAVVALVALAMLATPVLAIGPENALGKNPNLVGPRPWGFDLILDNGVGHGWITATPIPKSHLILNALSFKINNAFVVTNPAQPLGMENKWLFFSQSMLYDHWVLMGMNPAIAAMIVSNFPEGAYMKWNFVGQ